jgi:hypothetical protein
MRALRHPPHHYRALPDGGRGRAAKVGRRVILSCARGRKKPPPISSLGTRPTGLEENNRPELEGAGWVEEWRASRASVSLYLWRITLAVQSGTFPEI